MHTLYTNCVLFDGSDGCSARPGSAILVDGTTIAAVYFGDIPIPELPRADTYVDLEGAFVMPGFINAHAHHFGFGKPSAHLTGGIGQKLLLSFAHSALGKPYLKTVAHKALQAALFSGVTTERGVGDLSYADVAVRDAIAAQKLQGPRFVVSGPAITCPGGHGANTFASVATTPEEFAKEVDIRAAHGVDFIKITVTGGVMDSEVKGEAGLLRMSLEQTQAAVEAARAHGLYVASHTEGPEGVEVCINAGVYTIEHGAPVAPELLARWKSSGAADVCTASVAYPLSVMPTSVSKLPEAGLYNSALIRNRVVEAARACREAGIPVALGTDAACPFVTHYDFWREILLYHELVGASPAEALRCATLGTARVLHLDDITGSIEPGKDADFIAFNVGANPLENLYDLRLVNKVVARGTLIDNCAEKLKGYRLPEIDKLLDGLYTLERLAAIAQESHAAPAE
ncbi:MAG: amidohydrolase family protein [Atopobiaceae bacterium]|jgi:imidazolonepropionase-like amidohydrolase